jgi:hypothetical protein
MGNNTKRIGKKIDDTTFLEVTQDLKHFKAKF